MAETKKTTPAKKPATKAKSTASAKKPAAKKSAAEGGANYTKPELREHLKEKIQAGEKGGRAGQWSARKAQLLASEYKKEGGTYKDGGKNSGQKHLEAWTKEKWQTASGEKAIHGKTTSRYLPGKAWDKLSPTEKKATNTKKEAASKKGQQFVANTTAAKKARKSASK